MGFKPARHEPCLYSGTVDGDQVFFLRHVDNFAVAAPRTSTCDAIIQYINSKMSMDVKGLGIIGRFNGLDIHQTKHYVKITCARYITKMLQEHGWHHEGPKPIMSLPLPSEADFVKALENSAPPKTIPEAEVRSSEDYGV